MNKKDYLSLQPGDKVRLHKTFTATRILDDYGFTWQSLKPGESLAERLAGKTVTVKRLDDKKRGTLVVEADDDSWFITRRLIRAKVEPESANAPALSNVVPPDGYRLLSDDEVIESGDLWWNAHQGCEWVEAFGVVGQTPSFFRSKGYESRAACRKIAPPPAPAFPADDPRSNEWRDMGPAEVLRVGDFYYSGATEKWSAGRGLDGFTVRSTARKMGRRRVRRYAPGPSYRYLDDDEVILETDRFGFADIPSSETLLRAPRDWMGSSINPIVGATPRGVRASSDWFGQFFVVREHPE